MSKRIYILISICILGILLAIVFLGRPKSEALVKATELSPPQTEETKHTENSHKVLKLSDKAIQNAKLELLKAGPVTLREKISFPGQIAVDEHLLQAVPSRFSGVVISMAHHAGERVKKGDLLATLESRELADLKLEYLSFRDKSIQAQRLRDQEGRLQTHIKNLIRLLQTNKPFQEIHQQALSLEIGAHKAALLENYTRLRTSSENLKREEKLYQEKLSSEQEFLQARQNHETAQADYIASLEEISRNQQNRYQAQKLEAELTIGAEQTAIQKLKALGYQALDLKNMSQGNLTQYEIHSPMTGTLIEKTVSEGQSVNAESTLYMVADLSQVWAEMQISALDLSRIKLGLPVRIHSENGAYSTSGTLDHLKPLVDPETRSAEAHSEILNTEGLWFPGMFITIDVLKNQQHVPIAIKKTALQEINQQTSIFVKTSEGFELRQITKNAEDHEYIEVINGIKAGETYVANNSFVLKSELLGSVEE